MSAVDVVLDALPAFYLCLHDDGRIVHANLTLARRLDTTPDALVDQHVETLLSRAGRLFYQTHVFPLVRMAGQANEIFLLVEAPGGGSFGTLWNLARRTRDDRTLIDCVIMEVHERRKYEDALLQAKREAEAVTAQFEQQALVLADQAAELEAQHQQMVEQARELEEHGELVERERATALEAHAIADAANRAKSEFLTTMSHELRTPLNAIGGYADLIAAGVYGPVNAEQDHALGRIVKAQRHLLGLINDILNLSRIEAGKIEYAIAPVHVGDLIGELRNMMEPQMRAGGLDFTIAADEAVLVDVDRDKTVQILLNLLSNAVKFTPSGGTIALRAVAGDLDGAYLLEVSDTGRGIPASKLEAIFEPFVQVSADRSPGHAGTGLGLAISRTLARGMGGELSATSAVGRGSTFSLRLLRSRTLPSNGHDGAIDS